MKKIISLILVLVMCLSLAACSGGGDGQTDNDDIDKSNPTEPGDEGATKGGVLKIATTGDISSMLAHKLRGPTDRTYGCVIFEKLFNFDANGDPVPYLLESYEEDPEALTYTFHVRKGIKFHDGSDLNAQVVAWNIQLYKDEGVQSASFLGNLESIEVADDYTVVLHLSAWDSLIPFTMAREGGCGYIVSKEAWETYGEEYCMEHPVTTAPFKFVSWEHDTSVKLEKFADYWQGEPNLDGVEFYIYSTPLVAQAAMENDEIQAVFLADTDVADYLGSRGFNVTVGAIPANCYTVGFEGLKEGDPFTDIRVRKAACYAIDNASTASALYGEYAEATNQYARVGATYYNDKVTGCPYDVEKAKALLTEAGYPDGFSTTIIVNNQTQINADFAQVIAEQLGKVGIKVELKLVDNAGYNTLIDGWDGGMIAHSMGLDSGAAAQIAGSYAAGLTSGIGLHSFKRPAELGEVIAAGRASDTAGCIENFKEAQYIIFEQEVMLKSVFVTFPISITSAKLHDADIGATVGTSADLWDAWLEA